ncbi:hypothetical protein MBLNU459_g2576t1 [Dothideomycetes sp. NU459]
MRVRDCFCLDKLSEHVDIQDNPYFISWQLQDLNIDPQNLDIFDTSTYRVHDHHTNSYFDSVRDSWSHNHSDFNLFRHPHSHSNIKKMKKREHAGLTKTSTIVRTSTITTTFTHLSRASTNVTVSPTVTQATVVAAASEVGAMYFALQANGTGTDIDGMYLIDTTPYYQVLANFTDPDGNTYEDYADVNNPDYGIVFATRNISEAAHFYYENCGVISIQLKTNETQRRYLGVNRTEPGQLYFSTHDPDESTNGIYCPFDNDAISYDHYTTLQCNYDEFNDNSPVNITVCDSNELWVAGNSTSSCLPVSVQLVAMPELGGNGR